MPKIADIEYTPNPNAIKFVLKEPITSGASRSFQSVESAAADPLAKSLFAVGNVTSVFYMDRFVTINKEEDVSWEDLLRRLAECFLPTDHLALSRKINHCPQPNRRRVWRKSNELFQ